MEIPEDIMRAAGDAILKGGQAYFVGGDIHTAISEALLAERERCLAHCARVAQESRSEATDMAAAGNYQTANHWNAHADGCDECATAIRTPSTGEET